MDKSAKTKCIECGEWKLIKVSYRSKRRKVCDKCLAVHEKYGVSV